MHCGFGDELDRCIAKKPEEPVVSVKELDVGRQREAGIFASPLVPSMQKRKGNMSLQE